MLSKLEEAAVRLTPYRWIIILAMVVSLVVGFLLASIINQGVAVAIRTVSMALAWWCWCLFLVQRAYRPESRAAIDESMFPRFVGLIRIFVTIILLASSIAMAYVAMAAIVALLFRGG